LFYFLYKIFAKSPKKTVIHPDFGKKIEYAFSYEGHDFYNFREASDMPTGRYQVYSQVLEDYQRKITVEDLHAFLDFIEQEFNKNNLEGNTNARIGLKYIRERASISLDPDLFFKFISAAYFTKDEDLTIYDEVLADWKIELFKRNGLHTFFLKVPLKTFIPQSSISERDFQNLVTAKKNLTDFWKNLKETNGY